MEKNQNMWGGRFAKKTAALTKAYTASIDIDKKLAKQDISGSKAHAAMLFAQGILTQQEKEQIFDGLNNIAKEIEEKTFVWRTDLEDVHMNIENRLTELIGETGQKLHTGRSRNDQVTLDFRLLVSQSLHEWKQLFKELINSLVSVASEQKNTLLPGYTHLQPAQPVSLAQHLLAYAQMFRRDFDRTKDALKRIEVSPLGAAALAGTTYPLRPEIVAEAVGFGSIFANSMDAVSDRDFILEALFIASTAMMHLSRLCEEIILWANPNFGFIRLPDEFSTGSSIMPQKKNPDVAELMRGKTGRVYGALTTLLTIMKGLPLAYNRDMQEDKEPFLDTDRTLCMSLTIMSQMLQKIEFCKESMQLALKKGFLNATELADYLVGKGIPFRKAHRITGQAVAEAEQQGCGLEDLPLATLQTFSDKISDDIYTVLDFTTAVSRRQTSGGTSIQSVQTQISDLEKFLQAKEA